MQQAYFQRRLWLQGALTPLAHPLAAVHASTRRLQRPRPCQVSAQQRACSSTRLAMVLAVNTTPPNYKPGHELQVALQVRESQLAWLPGSSCRDSACLWPSWQGRRRTARGT